MSEQFQRTRLLLGQDGLSRLRNAHIAVVGCGAVGGFAIEALARTGVGHLTIVDGDTVAITNINRQLCATHDTLGQPKTEVLKKRIEAICPDTRVDVHSVFLNADNCIDIFADKPDLIIDAIDSITDKISIIMYAQSHQIPILSSMGAAMKTDISKIKVAPIGQTTVCPLAARIRKALRQRNADLSTCCVFSTETPMGHQEIGRKMGSLVTITGTFGLILANEAIKRIMHDI